MKKVLLLVLTLTALSVSAGPPKPQPIQSPARVGFITLDLEEQKRRAFAHVHYIGQFLQQFEITKESQNLLKEMLVDIVKNPETGFPALGLLAQTIEQKRIKSVAEFFIVAAVFLSPELKAIALSFVTPQD